MAKSPDAFRTISEVADWLGVQAHVLRFWESKFSQVKPVKRAGGRRYYRPNDMLLLGGIRKLLHEDGLTIKGAQKLLREEGIAHVAAMSPALDEDAAPDPAPKPVAAKEDTPKVVPFSAPKDTPVEDVPVSQVTASIEAALEDTPTNDASQVPDFLRKPLMPAAAPRARDIGPQDLKPDDAYHAEPGALSAAFRCTSLSAEQKELLTPIVAQLRALRNAMAQPTPAS